MLQLADFMFLIGSYECVVLLSCRAWRSLTILSLVKSFAATGAIRTLTVERFTLLNRYICCLVLLWWRLNPRFRRL